MKRRAIRALASASIIALATPAAAQDTGARAITDAANAGTGIDDVIMVTARRREESIQEVPLSIQAVDGDNLEALEINQFEDVASLVPGLSLMAGEGGIGGSSSLRGISFDARASGSATSVEFYRNDAVIPQQRLFQALYDIERIEVLRGPQGTLRGRASPSGAVNVTTRRPDLYQAGGYMSGSLAEDARYQVDGAVNLPLINGKLGVRVAGFFGENRGNEVRGLNVATGEVDDDIFDKAEAIRASVRADPLDGVLLLDFNYEGVSREFRQYNQVRSFSLASPGAGASPTTITAGDRLGIGALPTLSEQTTKIYNWQGQLNLFEQSLVYIGQYSESDIFSLVPQDFAGVFANPIAGGERFAQDTLSPSNAEVHEVRLQNQDRLFGLLDYVVGYLNITGESPTIFYGPTGIAVPTANPPFAQLVAVVPTGRDRFRSDEEESYFGNLTVHLGDRTELSGGIRHIRFKADSGIRVDLTGGGRNTPLDQFTEIPSIRRCFGNPDVPGCLPTKKATIYIASAKHEFTDNLMVYATYGSSFRPGNSLVGYQGNIIGTFLDQFINLPDETSDSYEAGVKSAWFDNRLLFNLSVYHQEFSNYPVRPTSPVPSVNPVAPATLITPFNFVTPVDAKVTGFEAELSFDVSDNFFASTNLAYVDGRFSETPFPCVDLDNDNMPDTGSFSAAQLFAEAGANQVDTCLISGTPGATAPWQGTVLAEYNIPVSTFGEGFVRGLLTWKGNSEGDSLNPLDSVDGFGLLDLYAGVRHPDGNWDLTLFVRNALDTDRILAAGESPLLTTLRAVGGPTIGSTSATNYQLITTTRPREFGVSLRVAIGSR